MTAHNGSAFLSAVRRADVAWLSAHLDDPSCPAGVLGRLLRHDDPRLRHLGVVRLRELADHPAGGELAALLPTSLEGPPETALVLAGLYERSRASLGSRPWPRWREADLPARVRTAWLRAEILARPGPVVRSEPAGEPLYQAVGTIGAADVDDVDVFVGALCERGDPVLSSAALRMTVEGLHGALLSPERARAHLIALSGRGAAVDGGDAVVAGALRELAEPWAAAQPGRIPPHLLRRLLPAHPVALEAAARHGDQALLLESAADPSLPAALRQRALELLGDLSERQDIGGLLRLAGTDPLLFAGPVTACLAGLHRRGHFVNGGDAPAVVTLALADHTVRPHEIAAVLFTCRHETLRALTDTSADDPDWPRRCELLLALAEQGAADLPVGEAITAVLPLAARPEPFLEVIRALRHEAAEDVVLATLPRTPAAALCALKAIGGPRTAAVLREGLGLPAGKGATRDPAGGVIASHLRPVRNQALELVWHLTDDPGQRQELLTRLNARDLPPGIASDLGAPDARELALSASCLDPRQPVEALCRLARHGDAHTVPAITDLLLRIVTGLAVSRAHEPAPGTARSAEPTVPPEVLEAIGALGERLHVRGKIRPACLLDASDERTAGHALVAAVALDLLERPGLSDTEQAVLLELLGRAPYRRTRARTHRLLRHHDPHVRKHAVALLSHDTTGEHAQALSASLIVLTTSHDAPTVRQALLALGHARAHWAGASIAACLEHPVMNVKKAAADTLVRTGTPAQVPALLTWLGRHDNPGLRTSLTGALRVILKEAYAAVVLAAAERAGDERERGLLLDALDGVLSARAVGLLADRGSPVGALLLTGAARGTFTLGSGTVGELAERFTAHGVATDTDRRTTTTGVDTDTDIETLLTEGWSSLVALRVTGHHEQHPEQLGSRRLAALRPLLARWMELAGARPAERAAVLRLTLRACPAPWSDDESAVFTRTVDVLAAGLREVAEVGVVLETVAHRLPAAVALGLAARVRSLPPRAAAGWSPLALLRRCGALLTRADVERALAGARSGPDPWAAEAGVLREAFTTTDSRPRNAAEDEWRSTLGDAVRTPHAFRAFRTFHGGDDHDGGSRARLDALIDAFPTAHPDNRETLLDWMGAIQPLDAPPWTIAENARRTAPPPPAPHGGDLGRPRSADRREQLLAMLTEPAAPRRTAAARTLLTWPEPEIRRLLLDAYLRGDVDLPVTAGLARALTTVDECESRARGGTGHARAARLYAFLEPPELNARIPLLLSWWKHGDPATRTAAYRTLRGHVPADTLAAALRDRLEARAWGCLDLLVGIPLLRTPELARTCRRLRAEGHGDLADKLILVDGPLRGPDAPEQDAAALAALRARPDHAPGTSGRPSRSELIDSARTGGPERIRHVLTRLAEAHGGDREVRELVVEMLGHTTPRVRLHAHRISRRVLDRPAYLRHTVVLLGDSRPDIVRSAVLTLCHAAWEPALPAVVALLTRSDPAVRAGAADGLVLAGAAAVPSLRYAADHARPDRRSRYTAVLRRIASREAGAGGTP